VLNHIEKLPNNKAFNEETTPIVMQRQLFKSNLQEKLECLSGNPDKVDKFWLSTQILLAVYFIHELKLFHGNLKPSNILLNSSECAYIADFAHWKPTEFNIKAFEQIDLFLPEVNEVCYHAPENFVNNTETIGILNLSNFEDDNEDPNKVETQELLQNLQKRDVFSTGCI